jgi:hypothetical protein
MADDLAGLADRLGAVDPVRYPSVARLGEEFFSGDGRQRSDWAFGVLVDGILAVGSRS